MQPADAAVRQQALDIHRSFAVSAPAGSGKTGLLTQRVLALLAHCEQPENILAITFTKKAAAEMQQRIMVALRDAQQQSQPPQDEFQLTTWTLANKVLDRDTEKNWQLLALPHRLRITTIDSFCRYLSQHLPLSHRLGYAAEMLDGAEMAKAYHSAARDTILLLENSGSLQQHLIALIQHFNGQLATIEKLFVELLKQRDQWLPYLFSARDQRQTLESTLQDIITTHLKQVYSSLLPYSGELVELTDYAATNLYQQHSDSIICQCRGLTGLPGPTVDHLLHWQSLTELLLTKSGEVRRTINKNTGFPTADKTASKEEKAFIKQQKQRMQTLLFELSGNPFIIEQLEGINTLPSVHYSDAQWQLLDSLTHVLTHLVAQLNITFQQWGKTDFIEVMLAALQALGDESEPTDIALALDYRIQHILVDEFQDTSTPQLSLLKRLTAGWQQGDGRTLFVVGDAMQSCYGFRNANVGIFLDIRNHGLGDLAITPLDLAVNFRSHRAIVNWCNRIFTRVFPDHDNINLGAVSYRDAIAYDQDIPQDDTVAENTAIQTHLFVSEEHINTRSHEADHIAQLITATQQQSPEAQVAILVRKRQQVKAITAALATADIAYNATEIDRLDTHMLVMDLVTLTRALLYPNDRIAWLALLRSPCCGLDMQDLYTVAKACIDPKKTGESKHTVTTKNQNLFDAITQNLSQLTLSNSSLDVLARFITAITLAIKQQGQYPLRQWVEATWLQLGGSSLLINESEQTIVERFFRLLEQHQSGARLQDWETFQRSVGELFAQVSTASVTPDVEIMTIHKSKGLEFDTVIIPGLDAKSRSEQQQLLAWQEWLDEQQQMHLVISPVHATGDEKDAVHNYLREQQKLKQELESDRLFYVGCTRAIRQLHLLGYVNCDVCDESQQGDYVIRNDNHCFDLKLSSQSLLGRIWPEIKNDVQLHWIDDADSISAAADQHPNQLLRRPPHSSQPTLSSPNLSSSKYPVNDLLKAFRLQHPADLQADNHASPDALLQRESRYFGTVLHSALQGLTKTADAASYKITIQAQQWLWQQQLQELGLTASKAGHYADKIAQVLMAMSTETTGQWLLDNSHEQSQCELSLWSAAAEDYREYVIDRTFVDRKTGWRWIVDYKSSEPEPGQSLEAFLEQQDQRYRPQLLGYARLFTDTNIKLALYFPLLGHLYELDSL